MCTNLSKYMFKLVTTLKQFFPTYAPVHRSVHILLYTEMLMSYENTYKNRYIFYIILCSKAIFDSSYQVLIYCIPTNTIKSQ